MKNLIFLTSEARLISNHVVTTVISLSEVLSVFIFSLLLLTLSAQTESLGAKVSSDAGLYYTLSVSL